MKIIVDESVSYCVVEYLRSIGHSVTAISEEETSVLDYLEVFQYVTNNKAILITRDHHFTNSLRFPPNVTFCIIFIRKGNLTSIEEVDLIKWFFNMYNIADYKNKLITISKDYIKVR